MALEPGTPPSGPGDVVALEAAALEGLRQLDPTGRLALLPRVFSTYRLSLARWTAQLVEARGKGDLQTLGFAAHTLRASSASIGAKRLSALCGAVEQAVRLEQAQELPSLLDQLELEAGQVDRAVIQLLSELPPPIPFR